MRLYPMALKLFKKIRDEAPAGKSAAGNGKLSITHFDSVFLLESEKQNALLSVDAAAAHAQNGTKEK